MATKDLIIKFRADDANARAAMQRIQREAEKAGAKVEKAGKRGSQGLSKLDKSALAAKLSVGKLAASVTALASAAFGASSLVKMAETVKSYRAMLKVATRSQDEFNRALDDVTRISSSAHVDLSATAKLYARLLPSLRQFGFNQSEAARSVELFSKALQLTGPTTQEAQAAIIQFAQAMGSGVLRGEEFRSIMENANGVAQMLADGLGVPIGKLKTLAEQGKLTTDVVVRALLKQEAAINEAFSKLPESVGRAMTDLSNSLTRLTGELDKSTGTTSGFARMIESLSHVIDRGASSVRVYVSALHVIGAEIKSGWRDNLAAAKLATKTFMLDMRMAWLETKKWFIELFDSIMRHIGRLAEGAAQLIDRLPGMHSVADGLKKRAQAWQQESKAIVEVERAMSGLLDKYAQANREYQIALQLSRIDIGLHKNALDRAVAEKHRVVSEQTSKTARQPLTVTISGGRLAASVSAYKAAQRRSEAAQKKIMQRMLANQLLIDAAEQQMQDRSLAYWQSWYQTLAKYDSDWQRQFQRGIRTYLDDMGTLGERIQGVTSRAFQSMEAQLTKFVTTGKASFSDFANSVISDLMRIMVQQSITQPLAQAIGGLNWGSLFTANALGGVYAGKGISAFSNQVVDSPTVFPFAKGIGLMGEAGPEAIMPLTRTPSGHLGVRAEGAGGVVVNIVEAPGRGGEVNQRQEGGQNIIEVFVEQVKSAIAGDITAGRGQVPMALQRTYGLNRVAGAY